MLDILKNEKKFTFLFFTFLFIDILVKVNCPIFSCRYISKPPIVLLLFFYYYVNNAEINKRKNLWTVLCLSSFFIGDLLLINHKNILFLGAGLFFFSLSKIFMSLRFSHKNDFELSRLIPFSIILFIYTITIVSFLDDSLKSFFVPALIILFMSLLLFQFAFLRKDVVDNTSYLYVFIGVILFMISEGMMALKTFKAELPLQDSLIMLLYGTALYLITIGIVKERIAKIYISSF